MRHKLDAQIEIHHDHGENVTIVLWCNRCRSEIKSWETETLNYHAIYPEILEHHK